MVEDTWANGLRMKARSMPRENGVGKRSLHILSFVGWTRIPPGQRYSKPESVHFMEIEDYERSPT